MARRARKAPSPYELLDARQRLAIALLISAVRLPAEISATAKLWLEAERVLPGVTVDQVKLGDRAGALQAARALIDDLLAHPEPHLAAAAADG
ncbi:MAG TPA: hypothetical protein VFA50_15055 [Stellaceae bacterium]|nr:hypothetical protein [Stellaceae bacterium]